MKRKKSGDCVSTNDTLLFFFTARLLWDGCSTAVSPVCWAIGIKVCIVLV